MIDNLFSCDIGAFVTIQEAIMRLRTIGIISSSPAPPGSWAASHLALGGYFSVYSV